MAIEENEKQVQAPVDPEIEEMVQAGLHFGHKTSKTHPRMKPFIVGVRNTVHIINLEQTKKKLEETEDVFRRLKEEGKTVLLVGTKVQIRDIVKDAAKQAGFAYVTDRWVGGTLTNFETISKRIARLKEIEELKDTPEWAKYTKWEQGQLEKEHDALEMRFGGLRSLEKMPDAVFICDLDENLLAAKEAKAKGLMVIAITDTNVDPARYIDYSIPANDDAITSIRYILGRILRAVGKARKTAPVKEEAPLKETEPNED